MSRFAARISKAVARGLGSELVFTIAGQPVRAWATQRRIGDDIDVLDDELPSVVNVWRVPMASLPGEPTKGTPVVVEGQAFAVDDVRPAGAVWLVQLTKRGAR